MPATDQRTVAHCTTCRAETLWLLVVGLFNNYWKCVGCGGTRAA